MQATVLIFPMNISRAEGFSATARQLGLRVIGASSDLSGLDCEEEISYLPYVTDVHFKTALLKLIVAEKIDFIYAPHAAVWLYLDKLKKEGQLPLFCEVCNEYPVEENWSPYAKAYLWADRCVPALELNSTICSDSLPRHVYAGLHRVFNNIPGESDDNKIWLLTQVARFSPDGDIVEIGSAYGRSAYALAELAKSYSIGTVICVDPWDLVSSQCQGAGAKLIDEAVKTVNWEAVFSVFCAALGVFDNVNYIRLPSRLAISHYRDAAEAGVLESPEFGSTPVSGKIAILHIDGNHAYEDVIADIQNWMPSVVPGGWILLDDYLWAFGDGPRLAGDQLLKKLELRTSFVVGDTLCIQI